MNFQICSCKLKENVASNGRRFSSFCLFIFIKQLTALPTLASFFFSIPKWMPDKKTHRFSIECLIEDVAQDCFLVLLH